MLKTQKMLKSTLAIFAAVAMILPSSAQICAEDDPLGLHVRVDGTLSVSNTGHFLIPAIKFASPPDAGEKVTVWDPDDEFVGDASETDFTLSATYSNTPEVYVDGTLQTSGYTITGNTLAFATAPAAGEVITVLVPDDKFDGDASVTDFTLSAAYARTPEVYVDGTLQTSGYGNIFGIQFDAAPQTGEVITAWDPDDEFEGDASETDFTLSATYSNTPEVYVDGTLQTSGYTITGNTLAFATAPAAGEVITVFVPDDEFDGDSSDDVFAFTSEYANTPEVYVDGTLQAAGSDYELGYAGIKFDTAPSAGEVITVLVPDDEFVGDASETAFTLSATYANTPEVYVAGTFQTSGYSIAGSTLTFDTAPTTGAAITVWDPDDEFNGDGMSFNFMMSCPSAVCEADERVSSFSCVACPAGTTRPSGDDASGADTTCDATLCAVNEYVQGNTCKPCPAGTTNAKDDDASGIDTSCDGDIAVVSSASQTTKTFALIAICATFATYF